jgi:hypothetical protein
MNNIKITIYELLNGKDLRSISDANEVVKMIENQEAFDVLFKFLFDEDRLIIMRAIDAIEKITIKNKQYLENHKEDLIELFKTNKDIECKWHLALLVSRIELNKKQLDEIYKLLKQWILDKNESKIVRVNSLQALFEISKDNINLKKEFDKIVNQIKNENIASINARIKKLELDNK